MKPVPKKSLMKGKVRRTCNKISIVKQNTFHILRRICRSASMSGNLGFTSQYCCKNVMLFSAVCLLHALFFRVDVLPKPNPQNDTNYRKNPQTNYKNRVKLKPRGVPETLGGGLGTILAAGGAPEVSQGRPQPKK